MCVFPLFHLFFLHPAFLFPFVLSFFSFFYFDAFSERLKRVLLHSLSLQSLKCGIKHNAVFLLSIKHSSVLVHVHTSRIQTTLVFFIGLCFSSSFFFFNDRFFLCITPQDTHTQRSTRHAIQRRHLLRRPCVSCWFVTFNISTRSQLHTDFPSQSTPNEDRRCVF